MAEILLLAIYVAIGVGIGAWIGFNGPVRPDNAAKIGALTVIVLFWPLFLAHVMRA